MSKPAWRARWRRWRATATAWLSRAPDQLEALDARLGSLHLSNVLDAITQAILICEPDGTMVWANSRAKQLSAQVLERIRRHCFEQFGRPDRSAGSPRSRALSLMTEGEQYFDATITAINEQNPSSMRLVAVIQNVTRARRLQQKMDAIDNAGRELVRVDSEQLAKMDVRQRLELLERKIIRYTRELLHFDNFVIRLLDKRKQQAGAGAGGRTPRPGNAGRHLCLDRRTTGSAGTSPPPAAATSVPT